MTPAARFEVSAAAKAFEVAQTVVADQDHVAASSPVATIRTAARDVRLAAEAETAVSAGAGFDVDARAILHEMILPCPTRRATTSTRCS
jgi:hypothetical protein